MGPEDVRSDADADGDDGADQSGATHRSFRQLLHWATGDRDAEAAALADASPAEVTIEDAALAVAQAHNEAPSERDLDASDVASVEDAVAVHEKNETHTP
jgi:hypothetical protein